MDASNTKTPILIVGAGPTGLTLANALSVYGIPFDIIEKKPGPSSDSKGLTVNISSQFSYELLGLGDVLGHSGCRIRRLNVNYAGKKLTAIDFSRLDFHIRSLITQPQPDTEHELIDSLLAQGQQIHWNTELLDARETEDGVIVDIRSENGDRAERSYSYVVSCEGKASIIRDRIGAKFSGRDYPMYFALGDFRINLDLPKDEVVYEVYDETFFILIPLTETHTRIVVKHDGEVPTSGVTSSEVTSVVERYLGEGLFTEHPIWLSRSPFYMRNVDRLKSRRMFLAGDAAHLVSPIGGTGMNSGIQDAINLAWKLAYHLRGYATESLLSAYERERLQAILATSAAVDASTQLISRMETGIDSLKRMLPLMENRRALKNTLPSQYSGLGLSYSNEHVESGSPEAQGGDRLGDLFLGTVWLRNALSDQERTSPLDSYILAVLGTKPTKGDIQALEALWTIRDSYGHFSKMAVICPDKDCAELVRRQNPHLSTVIATEVESQTYGLSENALLLINPESIIAFAGVLSNHGGLKAALARHFLSSGQANTH